MLARISIGVHPVPVELVDEGHDRGVAHPADLHELLRLGLDPLAAVDDHQRAVHGGEDPVGVLGEVLVAGGVQEVDLEGPVVELHDRRRDGDPPLLFDRHPVARRVPAGLPGLDGAGELDRPAEEEELFGQRRLSRVRVADDAEGPALLDLLLLPPVRLWDLLSELPPASPGGRSIESLYYFPFRYVLRPSPGLLSLRRPVCALKKTPTAFGLRGHDPA